MTKLVFKQSKAPCYIDGKAFDTQGEIQFYRVVFYEVSTTGGMMQLHKHWRAYKYPGGLYVNYEKEYSTRKQAERACQEDYARYHRFTLRTSK